MVKVNVADYDGAERVGRDWSLGEEIMRIFGNLRLKDVINGSVERWDDI